MSGFLDARGIATPLAIDGPPGAPAILLVHSLGSSLRIWDAQVEALARGFRVVRYDLRGHGLTEVGAGPCTIEDLADDALAVLDACGVAAGHVAGVSIGGMVGQGGAPRAPARGRSLSLVSDTQRVPGMARPRAERGGQRAARARAEGVAAIADSVLARWVSPAYLASPAGRGLHNLLVRTPAHGYAALADALAVADLSRTTPQIR